MSRRYRLTGVGSKQEGPTSDSIKICVHNSEKNNRQSKGIEKLLSCENSKKRKISMFCGMAVFLFCLLLKNLRAIDCQPWKYCATHFVRWAMLLFVTSAHIIYISLFIISSSSRKLATGLGVEDS